MLKRLFIAVFTLTLVVAFAGLTLADSPSDLPKMRTDLKTSNNPNVRLPAGYQTPAAGFSREIGPADFGDPSQKLPKPGVTSADTTGCFYNSYWDPNTSFDVTWTRYGDDPREWAMRFDVPANHHATLYSVEP
jgi:hypothetical protein